MNRLLGGTTAEDAVHFLALCWWVALECTVLREDEADSLRLGHSGPCYYGDHLFLCKLDFA